MPTLLNLCQTAGVSTVIWYCGESTSDTCSKSQAAKMVRGSSRGRGTRAAGWFDDLLHDRNVTGVRSVILLDGIKGWARAGKEYTDLMTEYDESIWNKEE